VADDVVKMPVFCAILQLMQYTP